MPDGTRNNLKGMALENRVQALFQQRGMRTKVRHHLTPDQGCNLVGRPSLASCLVYANSVFPKGLIVQATGQEDRGSGYLKVPSSVLAIGRHWKVPSMFVFEYDHETGEEWRTWARQEVVCNGWSHFLGVYTLGELNYLLEGLEVGGLKDITERYQIPVEWQPSLVLAQDSGLMQPSLV